MKTLVKTIYIVFSILFIYYLSLPSINFPEKVQDSLQSNEPADSEDVNRRAYFTNYEREDVILHYTNIFKLNALGIKVTPQRFNYPPEEAQIIIRDQTRSTFLEEIVFPFRESVYINGFKPQSQKDAILIDGRNWVQKITIRHISSSFYSRILAGLMAILVIPVLYIEYKEFIYSIKTEIKRIAKL